MSYSPYLRRKQDDIVIGEALWGAERVSFSDIGGGLGAIYLGPRSSNDYIYGGNNSINIRVAGGTNGSLSLAADGLTFANSGTTYGKISEYAPGNQLRIETRSAYGMWLETYVDVFAFSRAADGAGAVALRVDTDAAWTNAGARLLTLKTGTTEKFYINAAGKPNWISGNSQSTVGGAGGASALPATPSGFVKILVNGSDFVVPYYPAS